MNALVNCERGVFLRQVELISAQHELEERDTVSCIHLLQTSNNNL
jgi:hypothetical protein